MVSTAGSQFLGTGHVVSMASSQRSGLALLINCITCSPWVHHNFCKLLIHSFSKLLLHYPEAQSKIEDFLPGTSFQRFIAEPHAEEGKDALVVLEPIKCHILMVGQMYFALLNRRCENRINNVAILRIKQILLLNYKAIVLVLNKYPNANLVFSPQGLPQTCRHQ
ncbi:hypothetical protein ACQY0O_008317 [Thecaphora frezii]